MSLKAFHIFFIAASVLLALGFGVWSVLFYLTYDNALYLGMGLVSLVIGMALIFYVIKFMQKLKHVR